MAQDPNDINMEQSDEMRIDGFTPATEMVAALRQKQLSAVELLELHLRRIERYNPALNAIVIPNYAAARQMAAEADQAIARGEAKPLLGLPVTLKDCIYAQGLPMTAGVPEHANTIAQEDARIVARLRAAGAVILGKTNVPPHSGDWQTSNPVFGRTNNPWNLARTPGGSTGGGAAAVAAGLSPLEIGGDFGGSIRIPAAFCGIYGHKPSETAVPRSGYFPGSNLPNPVMAMAVQGPLARSAPDLELALRVIAGPDVGEDVAWHLELPPARQARLADYRVAALLPISWVPVEADIVAALDKLAAQLERAGARVKRIQINDAFDSFLDYYRLYLAMFAALRDVERDNPEGVHVNIANYVTWFKHREKYRAMLRAFFRDWDVILSPANVVTAFPHDQYWLGVNGARVEYEMQFVYACLANLSGHPATVFPLGLSRQKLPIGLQALGPYLEDYTPIHFAALVAQELGGFVSPPGYGDAA
jgi:amidase